MEIITATQAFATLGHPGRLAVFRLLMRFAPQGVRPTEIAEALGMPLGTVKSHLRRAFLQLQSKVGGAL